ncbi:MAG: Lrp/AsnC family transcriptional regulator [Proteobacteria bacterium]|nr:Lrp/AsnC family transcriptional regulator [Pseudomonadota bacterium]
MTTAKDEDLLALLRLNAREPVAALARKLGVSRTTVQDRLKRLEGNGTIAGYAVKLGSASTAAGVSAFISLGVEPKRQADVARALTLIPQVEALYAISGKLDFMALVRAGTAEAIDRLIDRMTAMPGVVDVETAVILSTKVDRR